MIALRTFVLLIVLPLLVFVGWMIFQIPSTDEIRRINRGVQYIVQKTSSNADSMILIGSEDTLNTRLERMPKHLLNALVASEDHRFYDRGSLYLVAKAMQGLAECVIKKILRSEKRCSGYSTITQQLAKLMMPPQRRGRTFSRKLVELCWALKIEAKFTKDEILTMYANRIPLGLGYYGVGAAARGYFRNDVEKLNLFESALLAATVQRPVRNPERQPAQNRKRAQLILDLMHRHGFLTKPVVLPRGYRGRKGNRLPSKRFNTYLWYWVEKEIKERLANAPPGLYKVWTTMDAELQVYSQRRLNEAVSRIPGASQGAVVVMEANGQVLALVGGAGDSVVARGRNRAIATTGLNCPAAASTMKIVIYTTAFERGLSLESTIDASPFVHRDLSGKLYRPKNYDGKDYGHVGVGDAFAKSHNTASVRMLDRYGFDDFRSTAQRYGLTLKGNRNELGLALGQNQVCPLEMTTAYATVANDGYRPRSDGIVGIINNAGFITYQSSVSTRYKFPTSRDIGKGATEKMDNLLRLAVENEGTGARAKRNLPGLSIAGKTGTIDGYKGAWFIGYAEPQGGFQHNSQRLVIGIWIGNDVPKPTKGLYGGKEPARLFNELVRDISKHTQYFN